MITTSPFKEIAASFRRIVLVIKAPRQCWDQIARDSTPPTHLITHILLPLLILDASCSVVGLQLFGKRIPFLLTWHPKLLPDIWRHLVLVVLTVTGFMVAALMLRSLAPHFRGRRDAERAFSLLIHAAIPCLLLGTLTLIPTLLSMLHIVPLLLLGPMVYGGCGKMLGIPSHERLSFTAVTLSLILVVVGVIFILSGFMVPAANDLDTLL
jgi:hypothetical protein